MNKLKIINLKTGRRVQNAFTNGEVVLRIPPPQNLIYYSDIYAFPVGKLVIKNKNYFVDPYEDE